MFRIISILFILSCSCLPAMAQDSMWYPILYPIKPTTIQQQSTLEDSVMERYAEFQKANKGALPQTAPQETPKPPQKKEEYDLSYSYNYDFYTTLMYQKSFNGNPDDETEKDNLTAYYNLTLNARVVVKKFRWTSYFFNEYGYRKFIDSMGSKQEDLFYYKNNFSYDIIKGKLAYTLMTNFKSQFWPTYRYRYNSITEQEEKYLYSDYYSPGYFLFSGGLKYDFNDDGANIEIGLAGGKVTRIRNQNLFDTRNQDALYSIEKGKKRKVDFGINIQLNMPPTKFGKKIVMENFTQIYMPNKSLKDVKTYTLDMNNAIHFMFLKYMRLTFRTKAFYDLEVQEKVKIINQLSVGFYLTNRVN